MDFQEKPALMCTRSEMIFALKKYCHQSWFRDILTRDDQYLRRLLAYYQAGNAGVENVADVAEKSLVPA